MAMLVGKLGFALHLEGNVKDDPTPGTPARGRKGYEEWIQDNVTTLHDVNYDMSQNIQVLIYE